MDTFEEDITKGYIMDPFFRKVIKKMGTHPSFKTKNKIIYTKNTDTEKFCKLCKICAQAKGEYQKQVGKLHPLPIATRPWE